MSKTAPPIIPALPADLTTRAAAHGLVLDTYTHVIAGHGVTGKIAWSVRMADTDARYRFGTAKDADAAHAQISGALDALELTKAEA